MVYVILVDMCNQHALIKRSSGYQIEKPFHRHRGGLMCHLLYINNIYRIAHRQQCNKVEVYECTLLTPEQVSRIHQL